MNNLVHLSWAGIILQWCWEGCWTRALMGCSELKPALSFIYCLTDNLTLLKPCVIIKLHREGYCWSLLCPLCLSDSPLCALSCAWNISCANQKLSYLLNFSEAVGQNGQEVSTKRHFALPLCRWWRLEGSWAPTSPCCFGCTEDWAEHSSQPGAGECEGLVQYRRMYQSCWSSWV